MTFLLDTSVLIGPPLDEPPAAVSISVVTIAELHFGVGRAADSSVRALRMGRLGDVEASFEPLPVTSDVARAWGFLATMAVERGLQPRRRSMDLLIAATARVHGLHLLTRDADLRPLADQLDVTFIGLDGPES